MHDEIDFVLKGARIGGVKASISDVRNKLRCCMLVIVHISKPRQTDSFEGEVCRETTVITTNCFYFVA